MRRRLLHDLRLIGIAVPFNLDLRGYSKYYYGRYNPNTNTVIVYPYKTVGGELYSYKDILKTAIHECVHCIQWQDPNFVRYKGVMHDAQFKSLYNKYVDRAKALLMFREVLNNEKAV